MKFRDHINSVQYDTEAGITRTIFYWISCPFFINFKIYFFGIVDHKNPLHNELDAVKEKKYQNCIQHRNCGILWNTGKLCYRHC